MTLNLDKLNQEIIEQSLANLPDNEREFAEQVNEFKAWCIDCLEAAKRLLTSTQSYRQSGLLSFTGN